MRLALSLMYITIMKEYYENKKTISLNNERKMPCQITSVHFCVLLFWDLLGVLFFVHFLDFLSLFDRKIGRTRESKWREW